MPLSGADLGFYKGGCPIHLKGAPEVERRRSNIFPAFSIFKFSAAHYFDPCHRNQTIFWPYKKYLAPGGRTTSRAMSNPLLSSYSSCFVFTKHPVQLKTVTTCFPNMFFSKRAPKQKGGCLDTLDSGHPLDPPLTVTKQYNSVPVNWVGDALRLVR